MTAACEHDNGQTTANWHVTLCSLVDGYVSEFWRNVHRSLHHSGKSPYFIKARVIVSQYSSWKITYFLQQMFVDFLNNEVLRDATLVNCV
jgi:hypothetical protein